MPISDTGTAMSGVTAARQRLQEEVDDDDDEADGLGQ